MSGRYEVRHRLDGEHVIVYMIDTKDNSQRFTLDYHWGIEVTCPTWFDKLFGYTFEAKVNLAIIKMQKKARFYNNRYDEKNTKAARVKKAYERMFGSGDNGKV